ncbi:MAG: type VI secretion system baseplate subunit TssE [Thermodesulfovibrionia bacterium]|nr:type VI secretion system baseplate subunit TssE [Thermodesulfovibrionia bacterium]
MREKRLLERIQTREKEPSRRGSDDPRRITESVLEHLQRILNTWQGNVPIAEDYGVPEFTDFMYSMPDSVREIERAIRQTVQKYEPRLRAVKVTFIPREEEDALSLRFQINARLSTGSKRRVLFETLIDTDGKISVKG